MNMFLTATCVCNTGLIRQNNEDNFYFNGENLAVENEGLEDIQYIEHQINKSTYVFGVFDGMGGEEDGQVASYLASEVLKREASKMQLPSVSQYDCYARIIDEMNDAVYHEAEKRFNQMGCTAAMISISNENAYICNVGDSRIYRMRNEELVQVSMDHTDAEILKQQGISKRKPRLTQCIGISPEEMILEPYISKEGIFPGDIYLICSDGLTDMVSEEEIRCYLYEEKSLKECARLLLNKSLMNGGRDNITIILIKVE